MDEADDFNETARWIDNLLRAEVDRLLHDDLESEADQQCRIMWICVVGSGRDVIEPKGSWELIRRWCR